MPNNISHLLRVTESVFHFSSNSNGYHHDVITLHHRHSNGITLLNQRAGLLILDFDLPISTQRSIEYRARNLQLELLVMRGPTLALHRQVFSKSN